MISNTPPYPFNKSSVLLLCLSLLGTSACGDDLLDHDSGHADASLQIPDSNLGSDANPPKTATIVSISSDFSGTTVFSTVTVPELKVTINAVAGVVGNDPVIRQWGDFLYILDRFGGDSITILDRSLSLVGQVSTGAGTNPQDLALVGNKIYVATYGDSQGVQIIDQGNLSGGIIKSIDLSFLDPYDNTPNCNSIAAVGTKIYVSCQVLDGFDAKTKGKIAVIDTTTNTVENTLNLNHINPWALFETLPNGDLMTSTAGSFNAGNIGCLERISTGDTPMVRNCIANNTELYGGITTDLLAVENDIYLVQTAPNFLTAKIYKYDGTSITEDPLAVGTNIGGMAKCPTGHIVVADNTTTQAGIRVFDKDGQALNHQALDLGWMGSPSNTTICW